MAAGILIAGVLPPLETTGLVPVTLVTVPTLIEPPKLVLVPLIVIAELVKLALAMFVRVFVEPDMDLFVSVSVVALPTKVSVASGNVIVRSTVCTEEIMVLVFVVAPLGLNINLLVSSKPPCTLTYPLVPFGAKCMPMFVSVPVAEICTGLPVAEFSMVT